MEDIDFFRARRLDRMAERKRAQAAKAMEKKSMNPKVTLKCTSLLISVYEFFSSFISLIFPESVTSIFFWLISHFLLRSQ